MSSCAKLVSWPWPLFIVPSTSSTRPFGRDRDLGALARKAAGDFDVIGDADAAQLAARARFGLARREALPVGERQRRIHALLVLAVVVGDADAVGVGQAHRAE